MEHGKVNSYIWRIYVDEKMRGTNIGAKLFDALIQEGKNRKLNGMIWQALNWNEPALNFYRKYNTKFDNEWVNCSIQF